MQICIAGAGAIGCTLAALLAESGLNVNVLARGETLDAIQTNGIFLEDLEGEHTVSVNAKHDPNEFGIQDVVFLCTKTTALEAIAEKIQPMIGPKTIIVPMINGLPWWYFQGLNEETIETLDPNKVLATLLPAEQIIGCVTFMTAYRMAPGKVSAKNPHLMILGEPNNQLSERLERLRKLLEEAHIESRGVDNIRDQIWTKVCANLTSNPLSVVTQATLAQVYGDPRLKPLVREMLDEVLLTAVAYGARIRFDPPTIMQMGEGMGDIRTSMLQDYNAGSPLELNAIGYAVVELANRVGISMPKTKQVLDLTHFIAEQRQVLNG
ncbi:2-dehydropantoate 2-reductase [Vibrio sp.]|uniref:2-dehydropantoate 2-reductase n=1 Tax=Vibrio viridaestus TaxID=2487322 RepID=A0A3N9TEB4_9VIBR|nr:2-dehydropantoate 2-reductase [Vibrio viridaestus]MDC0609208.1 2-dehydropantoate 2-reductase [Vibrio sp.]RQW62360.1 2-dehydropantoate 2-reductase [Vibrio viridaestus]